MKILVSKSEVRKENVFCVNRIYRISFKVFLCFLLVLKSATTHNSCRKHKHRRPHYSYNVIHENNIDNTDNVDDRKESPPGQDGDHLQEQQQQLKPQQISLDNGLSRDLWYASSHSSGQSMPFIYASDHGFESIDDSHSTQMVDEKGKDFSANDSHSNDNEKPMQPMQRDKHSLRTVHPPNDRMPTTEHAAANPDQQQFVRNAYGIPEYRPVEQPSVIVIGKHLDTTLLDDSFDSTTQSKGVHYSSHPISDGHITNPHLNNAVYRIIPNHVQLSDGHLVGSKIRVAPSDVHEV